MARVKTRTLWIMFLFYTVSYAVLRIIILSSKSSSRSNTLSKAKCREIISLANDTVFGVEAVVASAKDSGALSVDELPLAAKEPPDAPKVKPKPQKPESLLTGSSNVSAAYRQYIKLRPAKTDPKPIKFLITGENICLYTEPRFLIILCVSRSLDGDRRTVIRNTWATVTKTQTWPLVQGKFQVKIAFILANSGASTVHNAIVKEENETFADIVLVDIEENTFSRSKLLMAGLMWTSTYCSKATFVLKVDEKTMVHIPNLITHLKQLEIPGNGLVIGFVYPNAAVLRGGKRAVNQSVYPLDVYPPHVDGASYVISGNIVSRLYRAAEYLPYIFIENVFITGIVREAIGAQIGHVPGFAAKRMRQTGLCDLHQQKQISITNVSPTLQLKIWEALHHQTCKEQKQDTHI